MKLKAASLWTLLPCVLAALLSGCGEGAKLQAPAVQEPQAAQAPAIGQAEAPSLESFILEAYGKGERRMRIPPGRYSVQQTIKLSGMNDVVIEAGGVTAVMKQLKPLFVISSCKNLSIRGLTLDYDPLPFTQGAIVSVADDLSSFEFRIHKGYRDLREPWPGNFAFLFDPATRSWKKDSPDLYCKAIETLSPDRGRFVMSPYVPKEALKKCLRPGDLIALGQRSSHGIVISGQSQGISLEDVSVHAAPGIAIMGRFCLEGHRFSRVVIKPGPKPEGATEERLLATAADAINYAYSRGGIEIESCDFSFVADDLVNFHGMFFAAMRCDSPNSFLTARPFGYEALDKVAAPGSRVRFLKEGDYAVIGEGELERLEALEGHPIGPKEAASFMPKQSARLVAGGKRDFTVYRITLKEPHGLKPGQGVDIPSINCPNFRIANNKFRDSRGSVKLMASHGVVEGNRIERLQMLGVIAGAYYSQWGEAGWVEDLSISGNALLETGLGSYAYSPRCFSPGAISIFATVADKRKGGFPQDNRSIRITDNLIKGCSVSGINIYAARDVLVSGNQISDVNLAGAKDAGSFWGIAAVKPIEMNPDAKSVLKAAGGQTP